MGGLPREIRRIHKNREITIPDNLLTILGWETGDQVMIEAYRGKLIIDNLTRVVKPLPDRLRNEAR